MDRFWIFVLLFSHIGCFLAGYIISICTEPTQKEIDDLRFAIQKEMRQQ